MKLKPLPRTPELALARKRRAALLRMIRCLAETPYGRAMLKQMKADVLAREKRERAEKREAKIAASR